MRTGGVHLGALGHLKPLPEADAQQLSGTGDRGVVGGVL